MTKELTAAALSSMKIKVVVPLDDHIFIVGSDKFTRGAPNPFSPIFVWMVVEGRVSESMARG